VCDRHVRGGSAGVWVAMAVCSGVVGSDWSAWIATKVSKLFGSLSHGQSECNVLPYKWLGEAQPNRLKPRSKYTRLRDIVF
jgi:hypothetical protein